MHGWQHILNETWLQHILEKSWLMHLGKNMIATYSWKTWFAAHSEKKSWLQGIVEKRDWDTLWNIHDYNIFYKKIIATYFGKRMIARTFCRKSMIGSTYWTWLQYFLEKWLAAHSKTDMIWQDILKKTWLQRILEKNYNNTFLKIHDWKTFWKKNMIATHSGKTWL